MIDPDHLIDAVALAILNSDRAMAGLPPVASRDTIHDSDGYVVNARAVIPLVLEEAAKVADRIGQSYGEDEAGWLDCTETVALQLRARAKEIGQD